jgi:hypothetical protein
LSGVKKSESQGLRNRKSVNFDIPDNKQKTEKNNSLPFADGMQR